MGSETPSRDTENLRHSFASRALALGEGLPMIGKLLGHTQVQGDVPISVEIRGAGVAG